MLFTFSFLPLQIIIAFFAYKGNIFKAKKRAKNAMAVSMIFVVFFWNIVYYNFNGAFGAGSADKAQLIWRNAPLFAYLLS